jgi:hypothetical protein
MIKVASALERDRMVTWDNVEKRYGKEIADKMKESEWLSCITVVMLPNGEPDIPQSDIDNAYRDVMGEKVPYWMWD